MSFECDRLVRTAFRGALERIRRRLRQRPREWAINGALLVVVLTLAADALPLWAAVILALASLALISFEAAMPRQRPEARPGTSGKAEPQ